MKILLGRGKIEAVPYYHQFDAYTCVYKKGRIRGGNRNWLQRIKLALAYKEFAKLSEKNGSQREAGDRLRATAISS